MFLKTYLLALPIFVALDMVWILGLAQEFYQRQIGFLLAPKANTAAAGAFYLLYIFGLVYFAIAPERQETGRRKTAFRGALYGLVTYGTYDLTNHATIQNWPATLTIVDMAWGTILCSVVSLTTSVPLRRAPSIPRG